MNNPFEEIDRFFYPGKVALVGVSRSFGFGYGLPRFLIRNGWKDRIYPVNPKIRQIEGVPVYPSVESLPGDADLACILVPASGVLPVFRECVRKGIRSVVVMSAGFAETGEEGARAQAALREEARRAGVRVMGPNCIGVVNVPGRFATCEIALEALEPGAVSIVAQSGVFGNILLDAMPSLGARVAKVATIGNRADLDETDFLEYLAEDADTRVIVLYLESVLRGERFLAAARRASLKKPLLACLGGRTEAGRQATRSHTGSLAGFRALDRAALRQAGVWIARDPQELLETAKVFSLCPLPRGDRTLVVTASGSLGVMAADRLAGEGLELARMEPASLAGIRRKTPPWMNLGNPLDVGPSGLFRDALDAGMNAAEVDAVIAFPIIPWVVVSPLLREDPQAVASMFVNREALEEAAAVKPVIASPQGHPEWKAACAGFFGPKIPMISTPLAAVRALGALWRYATWRARRCG